MSETGIRLARQSHLHTNAALPGNKEASLHSSRVKLTALALVVLIVPACESMQAKDRQVRLQDTVRAYAAAVRWRHFETAADFISTRSTTPKPVDRDFLKNIRITAYNVKQGTVSQDEREAVIQVTFNYYHTESATLHTLVDRQTWWYEEDAKRWLLDGGLPDFQAHLKRGP